MIKKYIGYLFIVASVSLAYYRGKRQAYLDCIDFNVMPFITNGVTLLICASLIVTGVFLIEKRLKEHYKN